MPRMKEQIANRLGVAHVRDTVKQFVAGSVTREQAMESLQIGQSRLYDLRTYYLAAKAAGDGETWEPGLSGGIHKPTWPDEEQRFLRRALSPCGESKRYSYAFAASELGRRFGHEVDRGQVRHWAMENGIKVAVPGPRPPAHVRRWQRKAIGELWQLDATPDRFLGRGRPAYRLLDMLDDCSRVQVGCRLYLRECVRSYLDLFYRAFSRYGLPLEIYVDKAGFFRGENGELTQLGRRLKFYDVSFVFANAPESKGKIERIHLVWQDRLPARPCGRPCRLPQRLRGPPRDRHDAGRGVEQGDPGGAQQAPGDPAGRMVGARLVGVVSYGRRQTWTGVPCGRSVLPDGVRERHEGVAVPAHGRHVVHRAQQAGARGASDHPFQQQSEGEKDLRTKPEWYKTIPVLKSTSFPVLKSTRQPVSVLTPRSGDYDIISATIRNNNAIEGI